MTFPDFPDLKPLVPEDHAALVERLREAGPSVCDLSAANLYIWRDCEAPSLAMVGDSLCILIRPHAEPPYFLEPVGGSRRADALRACLAHGGRVSRCSKALAETLSPLEFDIRPLRDHFDYIYDIRSLSELKGKKFDGKRNQIRKFASRFPDYEFRLLEPPWFGAAMDLFDKWHERRDNGTNFSDPLSAFSFECQRRALARAFQDFELLGLVGGAVVVEGEVRGFIIASMDLGDTALVHFQYADTELPGIYQVLLREACRRLFRSCAYVNLEEDLGLPGLRRTKLSYMPLRLEEKYEIRAAPAAER